GLLDIFFPLLWSLWFPLGLWLLGSRTEFTNWHGREAVRFQVLMLLYGIGLTIICLAGFFAGGSYALFESASTHDPVDFIVGYAFASIWLIVLALGGIVMYALTLILPAIAAVKASNGEPYVYPLTFSPRR